MRFVEIGERAELGHNAAGNVARKVAGSKDRRLCSAWNEIGAKIPKSRVRRPSPQRRDFFGRKRK